MAVPDLRLEHVMKFMQARLEAGCCASTVNGSLSCLRSFLAFLREDGVFVHPSLENIQRLKQPERLPRYIPSEHVLRLKNEVDANILKANERRRHYDALLIRAVFYLLWQGGLRSGEVEMLRFSDFYISTVNEAKRLFIRDGKWRQGRAVYLTDAALDALRMYLAMRGTDQLGGFVFVRNGMPLQKNFIAKRLNRIGEQIDVYVSPHRLRHTFATQLLNVGCKVTSIQRLLGHTNLNTTMTYARAFDRTVMTDYFTAIDILEGQPDGAWSDLNAPHTVP
jgi:site-specific recombinase XerD